MAVKEEDWGTADWQDAHFPTDQSDEFEQLAATETHSKVVKISRVLRTISPISRILLRAVNALLVTMLGSKTIAIMFKGLAILFGGKGRADEIAVLARKRID